MKPIIFIMLISLSACAKKPTFGDDAKNAIDRQIKICEVMNLKAVVKIQVDYPFETISSDCAQKMEIKSGVRFENKGWNYKMPEKRINR